MSGSIALTSAAPKALLVGGPPGRGRDEAGGEQSEDEGGGATRSGSAHEVDQPACAEPVEERAHELGVVAVHEQELVEQVEVAGGVAVEQIEQLVEDVGLGDGAAVAVGDGLPGGGAGTGCAVQGGGYVAVECLPLGAQVVECDGLGRDVVGEGGDGAAGVGDAPGRGVVVLLVACEGLLGGAEGAFGAGQCRTDLVAAGLDVPEPGGVAHELVLDPVPRRDGESAGLGGRVQAPAERVPGLSLPGGAHRRGEAAGGAGGAGEVGADPAHLLGGAVAHAGHAVVGPAFHPAHRKLSARAASTQVMLSTAASSWSPRLAQEV